MKQNVLPHRRRLNANLVAGAIGILLMILLACGAPLLTSPVKQNLGSRLAPPVWGKGGTWAHPFGTDQLGRDTLSRLAHGARVSLLVGFVAASIAAVLGTALGLIAGSYGTKVDTLLMRILDIQLSFPLPLLMILVVSAIGTTLTNIVLSLGFLAWPPYARLVRAEVLSIREQPYIEAAAAIGAGRWRIVTRHILPNILPLIVVLWTFSVPWMILAEAYMSWLGLSVPPPTPTWGSMIADSRDYLSVSWWMATLPGLAILVIVLSINLFGDWLRDRLDPRLRGVGA